MRRMRIVLFDALTFGLWSEGVVLQMNDMMHAIYRTMDLRVDDQTPQNVASIASDAPRKPDSWHSQQNPHIPPNRFRPLGLLKRVINPSRRDMEIERHSRLPKPIQQPCKSSA